MLRSGTSGGELWPVLGSPAQKGWGGPGMRSAEGHKGVIGPGASSRFWDLGVVNLGKRRLRGDLSVWGGGHRGLGNLISVPCGDRTRGDGHKTEPRTFCTSFFPVRLAEHWDGQPREILGHFWRFSRPIWMPPWAPPLGNSFGTAGTFGTGGTRCSPQLPPNPSTSPIL